MRKPASVWYAHYSCLWPFDVVVFIITKAACQPNMPTHTLYRFFNIYILIRLDIFMCKHAHKPIGIHVLLQLLPRHVASSSCDFAHDFLPPTLRPIVAIPPTPATTTTKCLKQNQKAKVFIARGDCLILFCLLSIDKHESFFIHFSSNKS